MIRVGIYPRYPDEPGDDDPMTAPEDGDVGCSLRNEAASRVYTSLRCPPGDYVVKRCAGPNCSTPKNAVIFDTRRGTCWVCYAERVRKPAEVEAGRLAAVEDWARKAIERRCDRVGGTLLCDLIPPDDHEAECEAIAAAHDNGPPPAPEAKPARKAKRQAAGLFAVQ